PDLRIRNFPAAHLALAFLAEQNGNLSQAAAESSLAAAASANDAAGNNCTEAEVNLVLQRDEFSKVVPCAGKILASGPSAELRIRVAGALLETGHPDAAVKALEGLSAADGLSGEAAFWRARCYEKLATAAYLQIYQADPNSYRVHARRRLSP